MIEFEYAFSSKDSDSLLANMTVGEAEPAKVMDALAQMMAHAVKTTAILYKQTPVEILQTVQQAASAYLDNIEITSEEVEEATQDFGACEYRDLPDNADKQTIVLELIAYANGFKAAHVRNTVADVTFDLLPKVYAATLGQLAMNALVLAAAPLDSIAATPDKAAADLEECCALLVESLKQNLNSSLELRANVTAARREALIGKILDGPGKGEMQ